MDARLEMLVEPFREERPGPHVMAAVEAIEQSGLGVEMGPFANTADGDLDALVAAVGDALRAGFAAGAERISLNLTRT